MDTYEQIILNCLRDQQREGGISQVSVNLTYFMIMCEDIMDWSSAAPSSAIFDRKIYVSPLAQMNVGDFQSREK